MAKITPKGQLSGIVGPVSYRVKNGVTVVQTKPGKGKMKQTEATASAASDFGSASTAARKIRTAMFPILQGHGDAALYRRFAAKVYEAVKLDTQHSKGKRTLADGDLSVLSGFDCNANSPFAKYCALWPMVAYDAGQNIVLSVPAFHPAEMIRAIPTASDSEICLLVTAFDPETLAETHTEMFRLPFALTDQEVPEQQWVLTGVVPNAVVVLTAAVFYFRNNNAAGAVGLNGKHLHPCAIVAAFRNGQ